ncbi:hypothetical protein KQ304_09625 [Synechococcus sp. CS-1329]|jgi:hypothetical protein|uniref:hypothetical protein n=1 Tax=Synechococcus sp. CS-1329 TaxID=2847975 RepID=UPI00223AC4F3|nr:hypothetical protein [Synechococcus sp. CS-1329]MCT0219254.1 hypothetical protein [Synechococcus sp. CS-1329]
MALTPEPLNGRRIVVTGVVGGLIGLAVSLFLESVVAHTPATVSSYAQFWFRVMLGAFGSLAGLAIETVRQLQATNPDPSYRHSTKGRNRRRDRR